MMVEKIKSGEITSYTFYTTIPMDNVWSMDYFLKEFDLGDRVVLFDGTYVEFDFGFCAHSGGGGDFYSHIIRFEKL